MSTYVVVPERIISSAASRVPVRTNAGDTVLASAGKDVFLQPVHQREVVGQAAIQDHRRVRVRVDQAGHDDAAARVDGVARLEVARRSRSARPTPTIVLPADRDRSWIEHAPRRRPS